MPFAILGAVPVALKVIFAGRELPELSAVLSGGAVLSLVIPTRTMELSDALLLFIFSGQVLLARGQVIDQFTLPLLLVSVNLTLALRDIASARVFCSAARSDSAVLRISVFLIQLLNEGAAIDTKIVAIVSVTIASINVIP